MGIPKFYRWISERYPCLSDVVDEQKIPDFDNMYLDMNGIIHNCSHPSDDPHFRITEEDMVKDIFHYLEVLFRMIRPQKVFFMAVDGVAPRAKMNQQRGRRFKSAHSAEEAEKKARAKSENLPTEPRFDSNCITPGTEFMTKLDAQLQYFIVNKISTDISWQRCQIIYSGHQTPGEGEHKIMDYIRYSRSQPDYDPNTRHCLYGLDADLMMLGLTSHEPNFTLLREQVKFSKQAQKKKTSAPEEIEFHLLHLSLMRDYINYEFSGLHSIPCGYDLESIIDDFVFLSFLVGNDFIPHLPGLHINKEGLPILQKVYKSAMKKMNGYLNEKGTLNLQRFEIFMSELTEFDIEQFRDLNADLKYIKSKQLNKEPMGDPAFFESLEPEDSVSKAEISETFERLNIEPLPDFLLSESDSEEDTFDEEFTLHKHHYYKQKMGIESVTSEVLEDQTMNYIQGLQWILNYYYNGVSSWSWFYPFHYAPYISDVKNFMNQKFNFNKGQPFKPFEQLLAVLPPNSANLLPKSYHRLMFEESSLVRHYYPRDFKTDLNGKTHDWEAVVLVPFIDENILLQEMKPCNERLSEEEQLRNSESPHRIYQYTEKSLGSYPATAHFPPIISSHAAVEMCKRSEWELAPCDILKGLHPKADVTKYFEGFPTLKHIPHTFELKFDGIKLFEYSSKGESFLLKVQSNYKELTKDLVTEIFRKPIYVQWPHLREALVMRLCNGESEWSMVNGQVVVRALTEEQKADWEGASKCLLEMSRNRRGIVVNNNITATVRYRSGLKYLSDKNGNLQLEKLWRTEETVCLLDTCVMNLNVFLSNKDHCTRIEEYYKPGTMLFMLGQPHYGSCGIVHELDSVLNGRIRVTFINPVEPNWVRLSESFSEEGASYLQGYAAAQRLNISSNIFSRITGCIFINPMDSQPGAKKSRLNIGMDLKSNKHNLETYGYTLKCPFTDKWLYSPACIEAVEEYQSKFPEIFTFLHETGFKNTKDDCYMETDVFPSDHETKISNLKEWLSKTGFRNARKQKCGGHRLPESAVSVILSELAKMSNVRAKSLVMQVKPHLLFKPNRMQGTEPPDPTATFQLWDRVVNIREGNSVPVGARGTIIACPPKLKGKKQYYEVLFDEKFVGGLELAGEASAGYCYKMTDSSVINISHGERQSPHMHVKGNQSTAMDSHFFGQTTRDSNVQQRSYPIQNHKQYMNKQAPSDHSQRTENNTLRSPEKLPKNEASEASESELDTPIKPPEPSDLPPVDIFKASLNTKPNSPLATQPRKLQFLIFGTDYMNWSVIRKRGIFRNDRGYVICKEFPSPNDQVAIYMDIQKIFRHMKVQFNGPDILCSTNSAGFIEPYFFEKVLDMKTNKIIPLYNEPNQPRPMGPVGPRGPDMWRPRGFHPRPNIRHDKPKPAQFIPLQVCLKQAPIPDGKLNEKKTQEQSSNGDPVNHPSVRVPVSKNRKPKTSRLAANLPGVEKD